MTSTLSDIYVDAHSKEANNEIFQINDILLDVLPSDVVAIGDNAVYEESFIRTKSVFAFRSKYSRSKIIITLPISLNAFAEMESGSKSSQEQGLLALYQLSTRPYCFIKSQRVRSYLSSRAKISSTGFMMFAVDEINTVHDLRVPDVMFAEIHLMFCDHTSQTADFKFVSGVMGAGVDDPALSLTFKEAYNTGYEDVSKALEFAIKGAADLSESDSHVYRADATSLGSVIIMGPNVLNRTEEGEDAYQEDLAKIKEMGYYKEVKVSSPTGQESMTETFMRGSNAPDEETKDELRDEVQHFHIYWTNFHDLSFGGASSMKSIKVSRKNKLAPLYIGTHKYPFVQYMGKYPARVEIGLEFNSQEVYNQNEISVVSAVGQLTNLLDYNNEFYPEISAYNTLKMTSISNAILGVENVVPNQTFISTSSSENGKESVTISFIEADVEEFMKTGLKFEGRPNQYMDGEDIETKTVLAYLRAVAASEETRNKIVESPNRELHAKVTQSVGSALQSFKAEMFGIGNEKEAIGQALVVTDKDKEEARKAVISQYNEQINYEKDKEAKEALIKKRDDQLKVLESGIAGNKFAQTVSKLNTTDYSWPEKNTIFPDPKYDPTLTKAFITILEKREQLIAAGETKDTENPTSSRLNYAVKDIDNDTVQVKDASELYSTRGATLSKIKEAYQAIVSLRTKGDELATSLLSSGGTNTEYLEARINSYAGTNLPDLELPALTDPRVDPFYFLVAKPYFTADSLASTYTTLSKDLDGKLDAIITNKLELSDSSLLGKSGAFSMFSETGVSVDEMYVIAESDDTTVYNAAGVALDVAQFGGSYSGTGYQGLNTANASKYDPLFLKYAAEHNVDAGFIKAMAHVESGFNPNARSPVGAVGLVQFMPDTARDFGITDRTNAEQSIMGACKYVAYLSKLPYINGKYELIAAAYNAGQGNVKKYGGIPPFTETQNHVRKVMNAYNTLYKSGLSAAPKNAAYSATTSDTNQTKANLANAAANTANKTNNPNTNKTVDTANKYQKVQVKSVIDGDTVNVELNGKTVTIRAKGYDTPETGHKAKVTNADGKEIVYSTSGQSYGENSKKVLSNIIMKEGGYILIEKNLEKDPYDRSLSSIYLPSSNANLAETMISSGNGLLYQTEDAGGSSINRLKELQNNAKRNGTGLWSLGFVDSQSARDNKNSKAALEKALKATKTKEEAIAVLKKFGKTVDAKEELKYGKETIDSSKLGTTKASASTPSQKDDKINLDYKKLASTNKDIHVKGHTENDVTSQWGLRNISKRGMHEGIDSSGQKGRFEVIAAADGIVHHKPMGGGGNAVVMNHGNGFVTKYLHLREYSTANGAKVKAGTKIGVMGNTDQRNGAASNSIPVHLHQETWVNPYGQTGEFNLNPWKTTSLKLLQNYDANDIHKNFELFIDKSHLLSAHPDHAGKSVLTNAVAKARVFKGGGAGSSTGAGVASDTSGIVAANGEAGEAYLARPSQKIASRQIDRSVSVYNELGAAKIQAQTMAYLQQYHMNIAYPAIKVYVIVGNEAEDALSKKELKPNYYFEVDGVKDFRLVCNNDENPVDFLSFNIANASFIRTDNVAVAGKYLMKDLSNIGTSAEVSFISDRVKLKPGTKLHIRAGYGNDPNKLKTIFNGVITEIGNEAGVSLAVLAEGYGRELLMDAISPHKPTTPGNFTTNNSTPLVISEALGNREGVAHFGNKVNFWSTVGAFVTSLPGGLDIKAHDYSDPETKRLTTHYADLSYRPGNYRQRLFTNIYAAEIETLHQNYNSTWWNRIGNLFSLTEQSGYYYVFHGQTPWAVLKEMEYRHPGTLAKPLFYQDRMTMFFGLKEQMYIARDLDSAFMKKIYTEDDVDVKSDYMRNRPLRMDTVLGFHILSSELNILQNNIAINSQFSSGVNVVYFEDKEDIVEKAENDDLKEFKMKADDNLSAFEHRYKTIEMPGIHGKYSAFMYGTTELRREAEKMYSGNILLVGNPCIKAGDFAYISDNLRRFNGMIKIRECRHYMDEQRGYVTEITPGLYVEASSFVYSALFTKLSFTARTALATAALSTQMVSNEAADFKQYMEYFDSIKSFVKKKRGFLDIDLWFKAAWNETGIAGPVTGMALTALSASGLLKIATGVSRMRMVKKATSRIVWSADDTKAVKNMITAASKDMSWFKSSTSKSIWESAKGSFSKMGKSASLTQNAGALLKGGAKVASVPAWYGATRALKAITTIGTVFMATNPIGWLIRIAGQLALSYAFAKVQEAELTRQPLLIFPILYNGRPYTGGLSGYNYNTYWEAAKENMTTNWKAVTKAATSIEATSENTLLKSVSGMVANTNLPAGYGDSFNQFQIDKMTNKQKGYDINTITGD